MTLKDQATADVVNVFGNLGEFAENALCFPDGGATSFPVVLTLGDIADLIQMADNNEIDQRRMQALAPLPTLQAGFLTVTGTSRNPRRGDVFTFAGVAVAGTWTVENSAEDDLGGAMMWLRREARHASGGTGAMAVR